MPPPTDFTPPWTLWRMFQTWKGLVYGRTVTIPTVDLRGKSVLITGANSGIGREAALLFSAWGANVILACRPHPPAHEPHPEAVVEECLAAAAAAGHRDGLIEWWECDMASLASVEAAGSRYRQTGKPLDILVNNAGMPQLDETILTRDGFEMLHQVNFLSHTLLTLLLLPALAKAAAPRIVYSVSCTHYLATFDHGRLDSKQYSSNKLYLQIWLTELQARMAAHPAYRHIVAHGVHPGFVYSGIWNGLDDKDRVHRVVAWGLTRLLELVSIDSQQGSLAIVHAATAVDCGLNAEDDELRGGARYFNRIWPDEPMPHMKSASCRTEVWDCVAGRLKLQERLSMSPDIKELVFS